MVQPSGVRGRLQAAAARGFTPFVNRTEERALLRSRVERVCEGEGQVVLLTGEAGIGKSRLAQVLREELADTPHTWLETGGSPHFANTPFLCRDRAAQAAQPLGRRWPAKRAGPELADALQRAGLDPMEALPLVAPLLDVPVPEATGRWWPRRNWRASGCWQPWRPGCSAWRACSRWSMLIEDLHWIDPSTLELLQLLVEQDRHRSGAAVGHRAAAVSGSVAVAGALYAADAEPTAEAPRARHGAGGGSERDLAGGGDRRAGGAHRRGAAVRGGADQGGGRGGGGGGHARDPDHVDRFADGTPGPARVGGEGGGAGGGGVRPGVQFRAGAGGASDARHGVGGRARKAGGCGADARPRAGARGNLYVQARAGAGRGVRVAAQEPAADCCTPRWPRR